MTKRRRASAAPRALRNYPLATERSRLIAAGGSRRRGQLCMQAVALVNAMELATIDRPDFLHLINGPETEEHAVRQPARILVVEDETLFAETLVGLLQDDGFSAAGPTGTVAGALGLMAGSTIDAAILDIRLVHELSYNVAYALEDRDIPFIFVTACQRLDLPLDLRSRPLLEKPFHPPALLQTLREILPSARRR